MASKGKLPFRIGRSGYARLRKASPFATLLLDLATGMTQEDVANFKMVLFVDRVSSKKNLCKIKHAADMFHLLHSEDIISPENMKFIQDIFIKLGRKDLDSMIERYLLRQEQCKENQETLPKQVSSGPSYTQLKAKGSITELVCKKRSLPDGLSVGSSTVLASSQESNSQMSISDDDKIEQYEWKLSNLDIEDTVMASQ